MTLRICTEKGQGIVFLALTARLNGLVGQRVAANVARLEHPPEPKKEPKKVEERRSSQSKTRGQKKPSTLSPNAGIPLGAIRSVLSASTSEQAMLGKRKVSGVAAAGETKKKPRSDGSMLAFLTPQSSSQPDRVEDSLVAASVASDPSFDKDHWVAGLTLEQQKLLELEIETLHPSWLAHLRDDLISNHFLDLKRFLAQEVSRGQTIFPPMEDVYSWSRYTPFHSVKVVIVGQDPYHRVNQAHGLAFSVRPPTAAPPSLINIYKALSRDFPTFKEPAGRRGLLQPWADRGVLLINTCLTVRQGEANSHANRGWERLTQRVIDLVAARRPRGVVFMAWGTPAAKRVSRVDSSRHLVLRAVHPSPLSASRGFFDCGHFRAANDWLATRYGPATGPIDWSLTESSSILTPAQPPPTPATTVALPTVSVAAAAPSKQATLHDIEENSFEDDEQALAEAEKAVADAENSFRVDEQAPAKAEKAVADADNSFEDVEQAQAEAETAVADAKKPAVATGDAEE